MNPTDRDLLILIGLAEGPKHGYALMQDIDSFADIRLGPGSLYGALARLEDEGLIEALRQQERRQPYKLTDAGADALGNELSAMSDIAETGLSRLSAG